MPRDVHTVHSQTYMTCYTVHMEVPITQFRQKIFDLMNQALDGAEVWVMHKGRRVRLVPEGQPEDKLSRITPMQIIAPGVGLEDDSWKTAMMHEWEQKWDRRLGPLLKTAPLASGPRRTNAR